MRIVGEDITVSHNLLVAFNDISASRKKYLSIQRALYTSDPLGIQVENVKYTVGQIWETKGGFFSY